MTLSPRGRRTLSLRAGLDRRAVDARHDVAQPVRKGARAIGAHGVNGGRGRAAFDRGRGGGLASGLAGGGRGVLVLLGGVVRGGDDVQGRIEGAQLTGARVV